MYGRTKLKLISCRGNNSCEVLINYVQNNRNRLALSLKQNNPKYPET